ncbi:MAG: hypothetical protein Fur0012_08530 [Elusimicrobiota bacterium]
MRALFLSTALLFSSFSWSQESGKREIKVFLEPLSSAGWQVFFLADAAVRKVPSFSQETWPLVSQKDGKWFSQRGDAEINEAARIMAVREKYHSQLNRYLIGRSLAPWADGWKDAAVYAGINPVELSSQAESNKEQLLEKALKEAVREGANSSCVFVNGKKYEGEVNVLPFLKYLNQFLPEKEKFSLYEKEMASFKAPSLRILVSETSRQFNTDQIVSIFKRYIPSIKEEKINVDSAGKEFSFVKYTPAYVLEDSETVRESLSQAIASGLFEKHGNYYVFYDKNSSMEIRNAKKNPGKLEIFVMSQCPFGVMAENAVIESLRQGLLDKKTKVEIHYIADARRDGAGKLTFESLHGEEEWKEDARQVYIARKYPEKLFAYLSERNKNYNQPDWKPAAEKAGIKPEEIEKNFEEAKKMLEEDSKKASSLGVGTSPTFLVDSKTMVIGLGELKKLPGYEKLASGQATAAGGCGK